MQRTSNDSKASQTEVPVTTAENQVPEQDTPKNANNNEMNSQRVQYYQCPCCKCGNSHYQQLVSGSMQGTCCPASVAYEVPQRLSAFEENDTRARYSYNQNTDDYYRNCPAPYEQPQKRNGLDEDEDDPNCICPRNEITPRQAPLPAPPKQQQQQQQRQPCSCRTCDCCVACGRTIKPYRDNSSVTGRVPSPRACLEKCPTTCNPNRLMVDEEVMVVPTCDTKEVTANTMKPKPCKGSARGSQQSKPDNRLSDNAPRNEFRSKCERCRGRNEERYEERHDERYNDRRSYFCGDKLCGGRNEPRIQYNEFEEVCYCEPTCDPRNPACGTCTDMVAQEEKEIVFHDRDSQSSVSNQDGHARSHVCHVEPVCSLCEMDRLSEKSRPAVVDKGVNTLPLKRKCSLFKSKK